MDKKQQEKQNRQKNLDQYNSVTEKVKPENQNQEHNARKEAVDVKMRQYKTGTKQRKASAMGAFFAGKKEEGNGK
ncbi:MAG: hypothetical protein ACLR71_08765 [[Clostridium] scindens]